MPRLKFLPCSWGWRKCMQLHATRTTHAPCARLLEPWHACLRYLGPAAEEGLVGVSCLLLQQRLSKGSRSTHAAAAQALLLPWLLVLLLVVDSSSSSSQGMLLGCSNMQQARERSYA